MPPASRGWTRRVQGLLDIVINRSRFTSTSSIVPTIKLRNYQEDCIQAILSSLEKGHKRLGVSLATGAGKTVIFTQLIDRIKPRGTADQTLILAHRQELVEQAARHCSNAYPTKTVEIEMGSMHATGLADITVASVQSLTSGTRIQKFDPSRFKLFLVDEAHHIAAPGYMKALDHFGLKNMTSDSPALVGVSATLSRFDGLQLASAIDHIVYHKDYIDMIGEKWLSSVIFTTVTIPADISTVKSGASGDYKTGELSKIINTDAINDTTVRTWLTKSKNRKSTLVFCVDVEHIIELTNTFRKYGIDARFITGETPKAERSIRLDSFKKGEFPVLVNCGVFTEGTDIPNIDCVLLVRPTKSRNLLVQMIGRGMRLHPSKENCHIIDMVASLSKGVISTPTLFGLDPKEVLSEAGPEDMKVMLNKVTIAVPIPPQGVKVKFKDYSSIFDLISDTSEEQHIRQLSSNAWICTGKDSYVLEGTESTFLKLEKVSKQDQEKDEYHVNQVRKMIRIGNNLIRRKDQRTIAITDDFQNAVHAADTYANKKFPRQIINRFQDWRNNPASKAQIEFINKVRANEEPLTISSCTKGKAMEMISKIKHGAGQRLKNFQAERKREVKAAQKLEREEALLKSQKVTVGPLVR
ncbi:unnamed protein product [Blumeria hordei]|uniref:DEAD/DEAH box helicase n=2 Tax=Blumeria hordei TaxID=2867405 RepID=A0A383UQI5_BLUHO|nr:DEAD/DEAH box helicase [Blumeria hordei DH14]SZF02147.1 unnamed protein product [Blumeria hordei]